MHDIDFIAYANTRIEKLQAEGRYDAAAKLKGCLTRFAAYLGRDEMPFADFDALLVRGYHAWLKNRKLGNNSISLYIRSLKRVYRFAVDDGVAIERHPFDGVDVGYRVKKKRNGLTLDEVKRLRDLDMSGCCRTVCFARDMFLFSVYARGMRSCDMFHLSAGNIRGDRLVYRQRMTGREVSMRWEPMLQEIVNRHARPGTPYLFPIITAESPRDRWKQYECALHGINRSLKRLGRAAGIDFPLNMTVAHHSWESMTKDLNVGDLL